MPLTPYQTTNFRLVQTEQVRRQQFQILLEWPKVLKKGRRHCKSNFFFSNSVFKRLIMQTCKNQGLFGKGSNFFCRVVKKWNFLDKGYPDQRICIISQSNMEVCVF